jgi:hypothetical protein
VVGSLTSSTTYGSAAVTVAFARRLLPSIVRPHRHIVTPVATGGIHDSTTCTGD